MVKGDTNKHTSICESVKRISAKIISAQKEYEIALNREMGHHQVSMDIQAFALLKGKIKHNAINLISRELDTAKLLAEKFNQQVSFGIAPNETLIVEPVGKCCFCECELPMRFQLPCQCWLYQCVVDSIPIPLSLIHPRWFYDGSSICPFLENEFQLRNYVSRNVSSSFIY